MLGAFEQDLSSSYRDTQESNAEDESSTDRSASEKKNYFY